MKTLSRVPHHVAVGFSKKTTVTEIGINRRNNNEVL